MPDEVITRETALNNAVALLTAPFITDEQEKINSQRALAWIALADAIRPTPQQAPAAKNSCSNNLDAVDRLLGRGASATTAAIDAVMANYGEVQTRLIELKQQLRAMAVEFDTRGRITNEPVWLDAAMLILQVVNDE